MANKSLTSRLAAIEKHLGVGHEPAPTIFIGIVDASLPDPDRSTPATEYSDATTIGVKAFGQGPTILREPGESIEVMERRAGLLMPDCRVFFKVYADDPRTSKRWLNGPATL
jgi:hypothetical protein